MTPAPAAERAGAAMAALATSPCETCDARCCSAYAVHVTGEDVRRICEGTGLEPHAFLTFAAQPARTGTGFLLEAGGPSHDLLLAHARTADRRSPCPFLRAGAGTPPRCGVYPFRPRACRRFPAAWRDGRCGVRDGLVCPPGAWAGHDVTRLSWRVALEREAREAQAYAAVVAVWNDRVEDATRRGAPTLLAFLDFLVEASAWLVRWRANLRPAERSGAAYVARIRETLGSCAPRRRPSDPSRGPAPDGPLDCALATRKKSGTTQPPRRSRCKGS